jgi:hypothetical protein
MATPSVRLQLADGALVDLAPGSLIGRLPSADLRLMDPRISEVHALITLRGRTLVLLAQRGLVSADGDRKADVVLRPGQRIELVDGLALTVVDVTLPERVLVVEGLRDAAVELSAPVYSLLPGGRLLPTWWKGAALHLWSDADGWWAQLAGEDEEPLSEGSVLEVAGHTLRVKGRRIAEAGSAPTRAAARLQPPLRVVARFETVHIEQPGREPAVIAGLGARILSELVEYGAPAPWELVARAVYPDVDDAHRLRTNWDRTLRRLRAMLRRKGVRDTLIRADGKGNIELVLRAEDAVVDEG